MTLLSFVRKRTVRVAPRHLSYKIRAAGHSRNYRAKLKTSIILVASRTSKKEENVDGRRTWLENLKEVTNYLREGHKLVRIVREGKAYERTRWVLCFSRSDVQLIINDRI